MITIKEYLSQQKVFNPFVKEMSLKQGDVPDEEFDPEQLKKGVEIEREHTDDVDVAKQIAKAHLKEFPNYYTKLKQMEDGMKKKEGLVPGIPDGTGPRAQQGTCPFAKEQSNDLKNEVILFLKQTPNPDDDVLHAWSEQKGYDIHEIEKLMYELATSYIQQGGN